MKNKLDSLFFIPVICVGAANSPYRRTESDILFAFLAINRFGMED